MIIRTLVFLILLSSVLLASDKFVTSFESGTARPQFRNNMKRVGVNDDLYDEYATDKANISSTLKARSDEERQKRIDEIDEERFKEGKW